MWGGLVLLITVLIIVERVVRLSEVTVQSLYAAFSAYLLIGLMFARSSARSTASYPSRSSPTASR